MDSLAKSQDNLSVYWLLGWNWAQTQITGHSLLFIVCDVGERCKTGEKCMYRGTMSNKVLQIILGCYKKKKQLSSPLARKVHSHQFWFYFFLPKPENFAQRESLLSKLLQKGTGLLQSCPCHTQIKTDKLRLT